MARDSPLACHRRFEPSTTPDPPLFWLGFLLASRSALLPASQPARSFFRKTARSGILRADRDSRFAVVLARVPAGFALDTSPGFANGSKLFPKNGPFRHASRHMRLPVRRCFGSGSCWLRARHFSRLRNRLEAFSEKRPVPAYFAPIATPGSPLFWLGFLLASRSALLPASQMARSPHALRTKLESLKRV